MKKSVIFLFALATLVGCGSGPSGEKLLDEKVTGVEKIERDRGVFIALVHESGNLDSRRMMPFRLYVPGCFWSRLAAGPADVTIVTDVSSEENPWILAKKGAMDKQERIIWGEHFELHVRSADDVSFGDRVK